MKNNFQEKSLCVELKFGGKIDESREKLNKIEGATSQWHKEDGKKA